MQISEEFWSFFKTVLTLYFALSRICSFLVVKLLHEKVESSKMKSLYRIFGFLSLIAAASLTLYASLFTLRTAEFAQFVVRNETLGSSHWSSEKTDELPFLSNMKISSAKVPLEGEFQDD